MGRSKRIALTGLAAWATWACSLSGGDPSVAAGPGSASPPAATTAAPVAAATTVPEPEPALAGSATLTADACTFSATQAIVDESEFSISAINESPDPAGFDLWILRPDTSYDDWVAMARRAQETFDLGGSPGSDADVRPFADPIDLQEAVEPGKTGTLIAQSAAPGTYALQCWRFPAEGPMHLQAAGPIVVAP